MPGNMGARLAENGGGPIVGGAHSSLGLGTKLVIAPRGHAYTTVLPDGQEGLSWTSALGFVGISVSDDRFIGERVNEAGITAGLSYFKGYGSLTAYDPRDRADNITDMDFVRWMLSRFRSVDEVEAALQTITIVPVFIDEQGGALADRALAGDIPSPPRYLRAMLPARLFESLPLTCHCCITDYGCDSSTPERVAHPLSSSPFGRSAT